jgi:hypothetical protein
MRFVCATVLILGLALPAAAQDNQGWSFSGSFSGSVNSAGAVTKLEPELGYRFNKHFSSYIGVPFYFVNVSSTDGASNGGFMTGIGNAFLGFQGEIESEVVNYTSNLLLTAPTGDKSRGFSTGRMTVDWTNRFSRRFGSLTPFGSAGIANTVSDTAFFIRPFTTLGIVSHFEGGATLDLSPVSWFGASAYAVRGAGEQRVISKVVPGPRSDRIDGARAGDRVFETLPETVSEARIVNDHGFSTWLGVSPKSEVNFYGGYSRSMGFAYNTVFFGVGFNIGR